MTKEEHDKNLAEFLTAAAKYNLEFNDSKTAAVNFLQLWIVPEIENITPYYNQKIFEALERKIMLSIEQKPEV